MMSWATAVYTTVFPNALPFLAPFVDSIARQSDLQFDLWVGLDRLGIEDVAEAFCVPQQVRWVPPEPGDTFATVRQRAWEAIGDRYEAVVLVDSDDVLHQQRVARAKRGLAGADVYACALRLIDADGSPLDRTLGVQEPRDWRSLLASRNVFGLSNTAYRCDMLSRCLPLPETIGLIDWHLVSRAVDRGARLHFDAEPLMDYRLYAASTSKIVPPFKPRDVELATGLVLQHYEYVTPHLGHDSEFHGRVVERWREVRRFNGLGGDRLEAYVQALNRIEQEVFLWWEIVANDTLRSLWNLST